MSESVSLLCVWHGEASPSPMHFFHESSLGPRSRSQLITRTIFAILIAKRRDRQVNRGGRAERPPPVGYKIYSTISVHVFKYKFILHPNGRLRIAVAGLERENTRNPQISMGADMKEGPPLA